MPLRGEPTVMRRSSTARRRTDQEIRDARTRRTASREALVRSWPATARAQERVEKWRAQVAEYEKAMQIKALETGNGDSLRKSRIRDCDPWRTSP